MIAFSNPNCVKSANLSLFGSKIGFGRILDLLYGQFVGVHAFGYNSAKSEPI